ncbi:MAG: glycosyltransferase [Candidatus Methanoperedens sp.]
MEFKNILKNNNYIYNINAYIKAVKTKKVSEKLSHYYNEKAQKEGLSYEPEKIPQMVQERIKQRGISLTDITDRRLRIFWVGANKEQDYSGFLKGLEKFGEVITFANRQGKYGQEFSTKTYDTEVVENNSNCLIEQIDTALKHGKIDILVGQMWANYISVDALKWVQKKGIVTVNISMDDRLPELWGKYKGIVLGSVGLADGLDLVLTSCPDCSIRYIVHGCPAIFWPMASDPDMFKPETEKDIDVCFVGNNYGIRGAIIKNLLKNDIKVEAYGSGWPNGYIGPLEIAHVFGRSKIILGIGTVGHNKDIYTLKLRDFDATMAGALYITHRNPDLLQLFEEGKDIECYLSIDECVKKIQYYLAHHEQREAIALSGYLKARRFHTWEKRISSALKVIGFLADHNGSS